MRRKSRLQITNCSVSNGFSASAKASMQRSSSNREKCRLKRRSISTSHWCCRVSGSRMSTRWARPESSC
ncbi:hypothetical protein D3C87_1959000 [compost metagenome]